MHSPLEPLPLVSSLLQTGTGFIKICLYLTSFISLNSSITIGLLGASLTNSLTTRSLTFDCFHYYNGFKCTLWYILDIIIYYNKFGIYSITKTSLIHFQNSYISFFQSFIASCFSWCFLFKCSITNNLGQQVYLFWDHVTF